MRQRVDDDGLAKRLRKARQDGGLSQARVAELLGIDQAQVSRLEQGKRKVSSIELALLADAFGTTVDDLLDEQPLSATMRTAARANGGSPIAALIEQATGIARILRSLAGNGIDLPDNRVALPLPSRGRAVDQGRRLAEALRAHLRIGFEPISTPDLTAAAEQQTGLICWLAPFPESGDGLYARDEAAAIAVVNTEYRTDARVRFTLAHEWGHHLFGDGSAGVCDDSNVFDTRDALAEMRANAFAVNLLLPAQALEVLDRRLTTADLAALSHTFSVSGDTAYFQAKNLDLLAIAAQPPKAQPIVDGVTMRSNVLSRIVVDAFNRRKLGSAPTEWVIGRDLTDDEFDNGIAVSVP
jgi:Zn-dependent peptidase ImmA (M78 family)/DNA-binding XRE family transcriptional regulator